MRRVAPQRSILRRCDLDLTLVDDALLVVIVLAPYAAHVLAVQQVQYLPYPLDVPGLIPRASSDRNWPLCRAPPVINHGGVACLQPRMIPGA